MRTSVLVFLVPVAAALRALVGPAPDPTRAAPAEPVMPAGGGEGGGPLRS